jgi:site-specific recombinase XerD
VLLQDTSKWKEKLRYKYASSKQTREKYTNEINAFERWTKRQNYHYTNITADIAQQYILEEIV